MVSEACQSLAACARSRAICATSDRRGEVAHPHQFFVDKFLNTHIARVATVAGIGIDTLVAHDSVLSGFDDDFKRVRLGRMAEGVVGVQDLRKFEAMGDERLGIEPVRTQRLE